MSYSRYTGLSRNRRGADIPLLNALFFPAALLYHELLLRAFDRSTPFFDLALLRIVLFSIAAGLVIALILDLLPWKTAGRIAGGVLLGLGAVLFCVERGCRATFNLYYGVTFMGGMAGDVAGGFGSTVVQVVVGMIPFILLSLVPLVLFILLRYSVVPEEGSENPVRIILTAVLVACQLTAYLLSSLGPVSSYYTYEFTANTAIPHFGLLTSIRLELEYAVVGVPAPSLDDFIDDPVDTPAVGPAQGESAPPSGSPDPDASSRPVPTGPNTLDIDFEGMAEAETDETLKNMHQYFANVIPSEKNQYTGMFEGKNLILITAEGFATPAIDQELTPTLYKLSHEGFVLNNFYQPDWTQSTCGGEFAVTTGVIPSWVKSEYGNLAAQASIEKSMPFTLARLFAAEGYSVPAWHNGEYDYYKRDQYLTNFGYDYAGCNGGGLELPYNGWPRSDLEMMEATADSYIQDCVDNGTPFHAYYMTISAHGPYNFSGHNMAIKYQEAVQAKYPDLSEPAQAYLACNMELDRALEYLVDKLEEAGIADDTLIVMTGDHYPYMLVEDGGPDYYNELRGFEDTDDDTSRYRNTLLMWSGAIEKPIEVDTPCSAIDIVPTLCNLFGLDYDSRLYSGRDIFAANYQADQYSNCMPLVVFANKGKGNAWITAAGTYECSTGEFTPNEGVEVDESYVSRVKRLVAAKVNYAKLIIQEDYYAHIQKLYQ